jgi:hypothetical protein
VSPAFGIRHRFGGTPADGVGQQKQPGAGNWWWVRWCLSGGVMAGPWLALVLLDLMRGPWGRAG